MRLLIGAIFKDEYEYILEWIAWHQIAGFNDFLIFDNDSVDGTRELLEALSELGLINIDYQPAVSNRAQLKAYNKIIERSIGKFEAIIFIDADEFLVHSSFEDGAEYLCLENIFKDSSVGMVGINWRCFGSSGYDKKQKGLVLERFTKCASDYEQNSNQLIKSASRPEYILQVSPHSALTRLKSIKSDGSEIVDFIRKINGEFTPVNHCGRTISVTTGPLRINHYVIKSKEEFLNKKEKRGDAMLGGTYVRGMSFFYEHDFDDVSYIFPKEKLDKLNGKVDKIKNDLGKTNYMKKLKGVCDVNDRDCVSGWLVDEFGSSEGLRVLVFLNGIFNGYASCGFYREDLKLKGLSKNGLSGFRYVHAVTLSCGDVIELKVFGNGFKFSDKYKVVIS